PQVADPPRYVQEHPIGTSGDRCHPAALAVLRRQRQGDANHDEEDAVTTAPTAPGSGQGEEAVPPPPPGFAPGLEGHVAFRTRIAEPDKDGGALRYRGVDIEDLVGKVTFGNVWALLVDGRFGPGLPPAEPVPIPVHTGDVRVDVQAALAMLGPYWGYRPLLDISDEEARDQLARASVMALSYVAQSARGIGVPAVPQSRIDRCATITGRRAEEHTSELHSR